MKHILQLFFVVFVISIIISCEKDVTVEVPYSGDMIVVEGKIEPDTPAFVLLTKSIPFFGEINTSDITANTIQGATVIVEDGITTDTLIQVPGIGLYIGSIIRGQEGRTYKLTVISGETKITSVTTIPHKVVLDSVWWKPDGNRDSLGFAWMHMKDPDTLGNCYKWFAQRINKYTYGDDAGRMKDSIFIASQGGSFGDKFFNSTEFDFSFARGSLSFSDKEDDNNDEKYFFKRGDTIVVKFCSIDLATYRFWSTEEQQIQSNGNPFGSPSPVTSNIEGGIGIWAGYAPAYDTIIAQ